MLSYQNTFRQDGTDALNALPGLEVSLLDADPGGAEFDLSIDLGENFTAGGDPAGMNGGIRISTDLFDPETALLLVDRLSQVLGSVAADPSQRVDNIDVLLPAEHRLTVEERNDTARAVPVGRCRTCSPNRSGSVRNGSPWSTVPCRSPTPSSTNGRRGSPAGWSRKAPGRRRWWRWRCRGRPT